MAAALIGTAGCSSAHRAAVPTSSTPTSVVHPRAESPTTLVPSVASTATSTTTTVLTTVACSIDDLRIEPGQSDGATGHLGIPLLFTNKSAEPCHMVGYPGVAGLGATGRQATQAARTPNGFLGGLPVGSTKPPFVTIAPGQTASAMVEGTHVPSGNQTCPTYPALLVTPPNDTRSVRVNAQIPGCTGIDVGPIVPGATGTLHH
jgi:hypothetical protein